MLNIAFQHFFHIFVKRGKIGRKFEHRGKFAAVFAMQNRVGRQPLPQFGHGFVNRFLGNVFAQDNKVSVRHNEKIAAGITDHAVKQPRQNFYEIGMAVLGFEFGNTDVQNRITVRIL